MRDASKTGGALGQVSERELDLLEKSFSAVDPALPDKQFKRNLREIKTEFNKILKRGEKKTSNILTEMKEIINSVDSSDLNYVSIVEADSFDETSEGIPNWRQQREDLQEKWTMKLASIKEALADANSEDSSE